MHRITIAWIAVLFVAFVGPSAAQPPSAEKPSLKFDVASLKASAGGDLRGIRVAPGGQRYVSTNATLRSFLMVAYRLKRDQITGGPSWIDDAGFDMNALAEKPSSLEDLHIMLQNLITERFNLKAHRETKEAPVYVLSVDKGGPRMTAHQAQSAGEPWIDQIEETPFHPVMTAKVVDMGYFAWRLSQLLDRPVVDRTGLKGGYDFVFKFTRELPPNIPPGAMLNGAPIGLSGPSVFEALRQQLGLKLEAQKGPVETLVIDHAEKPAAN